MTARRALLALAVLLIACGDNARVDGPRVDETNDSGADAALAAPSDAAADASIDAPDAALPVPDLTAICGGHPRSFDEWEDCYRKRKCEWELHCNFLTQYHDVEECIALSDAHEGGWIEAERRERRQAVEARTATIEPRAFAQCLLENDPGNCHAALHNVTCGERYRGTVEDGGACYADVDCAGQGFPEDVFGRRDGTRCVRDCDGACCAGTCQRARTVGESCDDDHACQMGLHCSGTCLSGDIGARCRYNHECDPENWCNNGVCAADRPLGERCGSNLECAGDTECVKVTRQDQARCRHVDEIGDPCNDYCYGGLFCELGSNAGACAARPRAGEPCDEATRRCDGVTLACVAGVCEQRVGVGEPCEVTACMPGLFCSKLLGDLDPRCTALQPAGARCRAPYQCESYLCSDGTCQVWRNSCSSDG